MDISFTMPFSGLENRNILRASLRSVVANALKGRRGRDRQIRVRGQSGLQSKFPDSHYAEKPYLKKQNKILSTSLPEFDRTCNNTYTDPIITTGTHKHIFYCHIVYPN